MQFIRSYQKQQSSKPCLTLEHIKTIALCRSVGCTAAQRWDVQPIFSQVSSVILIWEHKDLFQASRPCSGVPEGYIMHLSCPEVIYVGMCIERRCPLSLSQGPGQWERTSPCMSSLDLSIIYIICPRLWRGWHLILCFQVYLERRESEGIQVLAARDPEGHLDLQVSHKELNQLKVPVQHQCSNDTM